MADQNDDDKEFEEEFDFETEESLLESDEAEEGSSDFTQDRKKPPVPVLIGAGVVAIVIIVAIAKFAFGTKEEAPPPPPVVVQPPPQPVVQVAPPKPVEEDLWAEQQPVVAEQPKPAKITPQQLVEQIDIQKKDIDARMLSLESKINDLLSLLSNFDSSMNASNREVAQISVKIEALNQELKMLAQPAPSQKASPMDLQQSPAYVNPTVSVHAIIPGRAWLKTRDGRTITVTEGDPVEGYGKVLVIDAPSGIVITSSGVVLR